MAELTCSSRCGIEQEQVAHLRHAAHVPPQQVSEPSPRSRVAPGASGSSSAACLQDQVRRLQGAGGLFGQRAGDVVVLALRLGQRRRRSCRASNNADSHTAAHTATTTSTSRRRSARAAAAVAGFARPR